VINNNSFEIILFIIIQFRKIVKYQFSQNQFFSIIPQRLILLGILVLLWGLRLSAAQQVLAQLDLKDSFPLTDTCKHISTSTKKTCFIVDQICITGNKKTKEKVILRELTFNHGDTLYLDQYQNIMTKSRDNLLNTPLFNYVTIDTSSLTAESKKVLVKVEERWYTWPYFIYGYSDRNFNSWWKNKDWNHLNYGFSIEKFNFRGRNEKITLKVVYGYREQLALEYSNVYLNNARTLGVSFRYSFARQREITYNTLNNELSFYRDSNFVFKEQQYIVNLAYRKELYKKHTFNVTYSNHWINDSVLALNPNFFGNHRNGEKNIKVYYSYAYDRRNSRVYPLKGNFIFFSIGKPYLGFKFENPVHGFLIDLGIHQHFQLKKRLYSGYAARAKVSTNQNLPYSWNQALGYERLVRGYEYYVIDGSNYFIANSLLKFSILPTQVKCLKFIPIKKFQKVHFAIYSNIFFDAGFVYDNSKDVSAISNNLTNELLLGTGIGLDLVTYYDQVFRIEYSINKFGQHGLFIHFSAPF